MESRDGTEVVVRPPQFDEVAEKLLLEKLKQGLLFETETRRNLEEYSIRQLEKVCALEETVSNFASDATKLRSDIHLAQEALKDAERASKTIGLDYKLSLKTVTEERDELKANVTEAEANLAEQKRRTRFALRLALGLLSVLVLSQVLGFNIVSFLSLGNI